MTDSSDSSTSDCGSEYDANSRSRLAAACRDKDYDEARHLLAAGANPKGSTCGFFNWTALHYCCQYGELEFAKELIEVYGINPEAEDKEGRTPLHISCQFGHIPIAQYLVNKCKCDPDYLDFEEQTPLHHAVGWLSECSEDKALKVTEYLILTAKCDPFRRDLNGKSVLLHACEKGYLAVAQYLIEECGLCVSDVDVYGNSCLHLAVSYANNLEMVKYLVVKLPDITAVKVNGNTILHAACAANSSVDIIKYLLMSVKCDPNSQNDKGIYPLDLTTKTEIKRLLYMHGATPKNVLDRHGTVLSNPVTIDSTKPFLKVLVVGNSTTGKTTLIKAIQREGSSFVFSFSQQRTTKCDEQTKGLQINDVRNKYGSFTFYDFAGNEAYRCSHSALLHHILYQSTAVVILVVDLSKSVEELKKQIFAWLSLINENCASLKASLQVSVVGSHCDTAKSEESKVLKALNSEHQYRQYSKFVIKDNIIALDCQKPDSPGMTKLRQYLSDSYQKLSSPDIIQFNALCLNDLFETKYVGSLAISVQDLCGRLPVLEDNSISAAKIEYFIPNCEEILTNLCIYMNDVGLALYIRSADSGRSFVIIDRKLFFDMIAMVFTPSADANKGVVCLSTLLSQECDTNLVADVLTQLEVCQLLPSHCITMHESGYGNSCCYVPALASVAIPDSSIWVLEPKFKYYFGWTLRFGTAISSRLIEILLVRLTHSFIHLSQSDSIQFRCWKCGMKCVNEMGFEFIAQISSGAIVLLIRSKSTTISYLKLRSNLVRVCHKAIHELCHEVVKEELFIDPYEAAQFPLKPTSFIAHFTVTDTLKAIMNMEDTVNSTTGDKLRITDLIGHDPYVDIKPTLVHFLLNTSQNGDSLISEDHMEILASVMANNEYLSELFLLEGSLKTNSTKNTREILTAWRNRAGGTYKSLSQVVDRASVFCSKI